MGFGRQRRIYQENKQFTAATCRADSRGYSFEAGGRVEAAGDDGDDNIWELRVIDYGEEEGQL